MSETNQVNQDKVEEKPDDKKKKLEVTLEIKNFGLYYGSIKAIANINLNVYKNQVTAFIGPSGCGKSTLLKSINRMNDLIPSVKTEGEILFDNENIYSIDAYRLRRKIGMVFQKPNPFPRSIRDNITWGPKIHGYKNDMDELVETSLKRAFLWDEVKDKLKQNAYNLSGGQQQRLCIARAIAVSPDILLMDEPASALDPISSAKIEDLIYELKDNYTIIIVTHNMQQASRVSDRTVFFLADETRVGQIIEEGRTKDIFFNPKNKKTEAYISGKFG